MMNTKKNIWLAAITATAVLAACGGGGGGGGDSGSGGAPSGTTAEGVYEGTLTGSSTSSVFRALVLEDGQIWSMYGNMIGGLLYVGGLIQGQGTSNNGSFTSSTIRDFGSSPPLTGTLSGTYAAGVSLSGTVTANGASVGLNGTVIPPSSFNYNTPAVQSNIAGAWSLSSTSGATISLSIAANGSFTGSDNVGCQLTGTITPRPSGKNVYNVQLNLGPAPCSLPNWGGGGIAIYSTLSTGQHQLLIAAVDSSRSYGSVAFGTR